jgi:hypothetical protein
MYRVMIQPFRLKAATLSQVSTALRILAMQLRLDSIVGPLSNGDLIAPFIEGVSV